MAQQEKRTQTQIAKEELRPKEPEVKKTDLSGYKPKDELFTKEKIFIDRKSNQERFIEADWLNISLNGTKITLFKGVEVTKKDLAAFNEDAKKYYLKLNIHGR